MSSTDQHTNALIHETSPYLLQHAHNPVHWMPWGNAAWDKARAEDKLVVVSIGYSACHWCHVMEHESFEDKVVADIMNDHFVSIKVDREERPDVDQIYMDAVQIITGHGGWPLNAICLPDGHPIYAGTYFQREQWKQVLLYLTNYYHKEREDALVRAAEIVRGIKVLDTITPVADAAFDPADRAAMFERIDYAWDYERGGRAGAPKFPMPITMQYLLQNYFYTHNEKALKAVTITLDQILAGGIYDQIGGGFARYSVDAEWTIPHFEKMLYDNAQLVSLYSQAYQITKKESYRDAVYETAAFLQREMTAPSGGFYSALDADSEGVEGKFYIWTYDELKGILGQDFDAFTSYYDVTPEGNFEHGYINLRRLSLEIPDAATKTKVRRWSEKLLAIRSARIRPGLDDKILTSWNALMLKGLIDACNAFGDDTFLQLAHANASFIKTNCIKADHSLYRSHKEGRSTINGFLDDYSFTIEAFIALYQATFEEAWLTEAKALADHVIQHFYSIEKGIFFYTSVSDDPLIARKTETSDNVIPSSNSSMAKALYLLGHLLDEERYLRIARQQTLNLKENALKHTAFYANWAMLTDGFIQEPNEVAICGEDALHLRKDFASAYRPDTIILGAMKESTLPLLAGKYQAQGTWIYVCRNKTCQLPVQTVSEARQQM
ncbi:MAG: thioredoxin domain-containing protein [Bacteroidetes bacterium]|nr:thioredoxin domain-containing protein [Bacteroidota bacterium]